jgi:hypothetical protein
MTSTYTRSSISNMSVFSVCIPRIFGNIPNKKIISTFENLKLGRVKNMDIVWKTGRDGSSFKMAFIHFSEWNMNSSAAMTFRDNVENPTVEAKLVYDDPWHWIVLPNKSQVVINSHVNEPTKRNNMVSGINTWNERISNLEDELTCIYEELYKREYIPVKYRTMCEWDNDIETGNISTLNANASHHSSMSPLTLADLENDDDTELHTPPPSRANIVPYCDDESYYSSTCSESQQVEIEIQDTDIQSDDEPAQYYEIKLNDSVDTFKNRINTHDKLWMTANCCGNA